MVSSNRLQESVDSGWSELAQTLKVGRNNHAAFLVPDEFAACK
jgi:hypothetical protein